MTMLQRRALHIRYVLPFMVILVTQLDDVQSWTNSHLSNTLHTTRYLSTSTTRTTNTRILEKKKVLLNRLNTIELQMALVPLPVEEVEELIAIGPPTGPQYGTYYGRTKRERYNRTLESSIVAFLGVFFSYFLSFVLGGFVATIFGALFFFWGVLSPDLKARQRNWEFLGGRNLVDPWLIDNSYADQDKAGLYGSIFLGRVEDVCVVEETTSTDEFDLEEFQDYTMESDEREIIKGTPYLLRLRLSDDEGRELQVHARLDEAYLDTRVGMPVVAVLLSTSQRFTSLAALTDVFIPDASCWVGDYPYLNRPEVDALLADDDELWQTLQEQGFGEYALDKSDDRNEVSDNDDGDYDSEDDFYSEDADKVPVRGGRRGRRRD